MSIDYKLAKQLKEAGYPQHEEGTCTRGACYGFDYCMPTLEELIEACGKNFRQVLLHSNGSRLWTAKGGMQKFGKWSLFSGHTAHEAVAKLWLALNKS